MVPSFKQPLPHIDVVVAIITNSHDEVLVARRAAHKHLGGLWEFPGGKVEVGELLEHALSREIYEELGIKVQEAKLFMQLTHSYPDKAITLHVWHVTQFQGEAYGKEQQPIAWIPKVELLNLPFPEANQAILQRFLAN
ncbi:MAG: mutT [Gammaproteobacteria bacterium]|jgi:8-oxo-dGTP diphosphatase|nr:mutT [Gammaproteobacteria bacterium]